MRKILLPTAAAATLIAAWFAPDSEGGVVSPAAARSGSAASPATPATAASGPDNPSADALRASLHIAPRIEEHESQAPGTLYTGRAGPCVGILVAPGAAADRQRRDGGLERPRVDVVRAHGPVRVRAAVLV